MSLLKSGTKRTGSKLENDYLVCTSRVEIRSTKAGSGVTGTVPKVFYLFIPERRILS